VDQIEVDLEAAEAEAEVGEVRVAKSGVEVEVGVLRGV
jgi:hypothetical protein